MQYRDWLNEGVDPMDRDDLRPVHALTHIDDLPRIARKLRAAHDWQAWRNRMTREHGMGFSQARIVGRRWHPATNDRWLVETMQRSEGNEDDPF